ncbi:uncharacterized protein F4807DRAFT_456701 [Annulohypoxylon truncatum]|uniref:uncharacterized protein n=1 Tax=Annulohypoxylon truncatum TaxID=327061 RepID=UPI002008E3D3|nr:uncharacterized protein F4807DRAFT_456701 [Annulohypoxylon truncatum]KAI1213359.1 hypothetical protein F4807DRAFT_456701 [Annulohypoxylon truncatum]
MFSNALALFALLATAVRGAPAPAGPMVPGLPAVPSLPNFGSSPTAAPAVAGGEEAPVPTQAPGFGFGGEGMGAGGLGGEAKGGAALPFLEPRQVVSGERPNPPTFHTIVPLTPDGSTATNPVPMDP